ncbi:MAG: hypothetical protein ACM3PV_04895 [Betaproteobacteria bacterium]
MTHPTPGELLDLHFGEAGGRAERLAAHVRGCEECRRQLGDVAWVERQLAAPEEEPPADTLAHVFARIDAVRPAPAPRRTGLRAGLPSAAAILAGALAVGLGGAAAAAAFFAAGTLVTLSLAPILILESQKRGSGAAAR